MKRKVSCKVQFLFPHYVHCVISQVEEAINDEMGAAQNCKRRVEHLKVGAVGASAGDVSTIGYSLWKKTRVERFLVDHLLRSGHYSTGNLKKKKIQYPLRTILIVETIYFNSSEVCQTKSRTGGADEFGHIPGGS